MANKSLFLGAAAMLALLMLFTFAGCSNPASDTEYVDRIVSSEFVYPVGTVFTNDFDELVGVLNETAKETNGVTYVAYRDPNAALAALGGTLTIPAGKVVYIEDTTGAAFDLDQDIVVETGGTLVLVSEVATSDGAYPANLGKLWVKGLVEVYGALTVTTNTLDVADYYVTDGVNNAIYTVIGQRVAVRAGGTLNLPANALRLATDSSHDKFTPAEAWAAAGQGNLKIGDDVNSNGANDGGDDFLDSSFTVAYLLAGVGPSASRMYYAATEGGAPSTALLPSYIPEGAFIFASGAIEDTADHNLTVNGWLVAQSVGATFKDIVNLTVNGVLQADNASFESVENLIISALNTENLALSALPAFPGPRGGWLGADRATLLAAANINIGDNGQFVSSSIAIVLPEEARIVLGKSASFTASGLTVNTFGNLEELYIGPASSVTLGSSAVTLAGLKKLRIHDGASLLVQAAGAVVNFKLDEDAILGKKSTLAVTYAADAEVDLVIAGDTDISGTYTVTEKSTLTVNPGVTLTVPNAATLDLAALKLPSTAAPEIPVKVSGTIAVASGGTVISLGPLGLTADEKQAIYTIYDFSGGKILLDWGATFTMGKDGTPTNNTYLVGADGGAADAFEWKSAGTDGAQIEISGTGITIRDTPVSPAAVDYVAAITLKATTVDIVKTHALTLEQGVTVTVTDASGLVLYGDANGGAKLLGAGKLALGNAGVFTNISGGQFGWQATGAGTVTIGAATAATTITAAPSATTLKALGLGATITELAIAANTLTIAADTTIDLGGTPTQPAGQIVLTGGAQPAKITLAAASSKIQTGNTGTTTGALAVAGVSNAPAVIGIANLVGAGTVAGAQVATTVAVDGTKIPAGYLVSFVGGNAADGTILTDATGATISSETQTAEDNT